LVLLQEPTLPCWGEALNSIKALQPTRKNGQLVFSTASVRSAELSVEPVEKASKQILRRDGEETDLTECATINDLMLGRGQVTPENHPLIAVRAQTGVFLQARYTEEFRSQGVMADELRWFYHVFGTQGQNIRGPLSLEEIREAYKRRDLKDDDMVWHSDNKQPMVPLKDSVLFAYLKGEKAAEEIVVEVDEPLKPPDYEHLDDEGLLSLLAYISYKLTLREVPVEHAMAALNSEDPEVRRAAAEVLSKSGDTRAVEPLIRALQDSDDQVRINAAEALSNLKDPKTVEPLIIALKDKNSDVRRVAAEGLEFLHDTNAVGPLISLLEDDYDLNIRDAVRKALRSITAHDFGKDQTKWRSWWEKNKGPFT
jgi:hypothetical protein